MIFSSNNLRYFLKKIIKLKKFQLISRKIYLFKSQYLLEPPILESGGSTDRIGTNFK
jgi:hypothetical protein